MSKDDEQSLVEELAQMICRGGGRGLCVGFCHAKRCADAIEQYSDTARAILPIIARERASARAEGKREGIEEAAKVAEASPYNNGLNDAPSAIATAIRKATGTP